MERWPNWGTGVENVQDCVPSVSTPSSPTRRTTPGRVLPSIPIDLTEAAVGLAREQQQQQEQQSNTPQLTSGTNNIDAPHTQQRGNHSAEGNDGTGHWILA